jgi:hypothetical protein
MSTTADLTGTTHTIPANKEPYWGTWVRTLLLDIISLLNHTFQAVTASTAATSVDLDSGHNVTLGLNANTTVTLTNQRSGERSVFTIVQGGSYTLAWADTVKWPGGSAPTITTGASAVDIVTLVKHPTQGLIGEYGQDYS